MYVTFDKGIKHPTKLSGEHMELAYNYYFVIAAQIIPASTICGQDT